MQQESQNRVGNSSSGSVLGTGHGQSIYPPPPGNPYGYEFGLPGYGGMGGLGGGGNICLPLLGLGGLAGGLILGNGFGGGGW